MAHGASAARDWPSAVREYSCGQLGCRRVRLYQRSHRSRLARGARNRRKEELKWGSGRKIVWRRGPKRGGVHVSPVLRLPALALFPTSGGSRRSTSRTLFKNWIEQRLAPRRCKFTICVRSRPDLIFRASSGFLGRDYFIRAKERCCRNFAELG